ncbi:hypothetical protein Clacol_001974 [Clathrus columnatus]|uniref:Uncharacterized protein n=1 Tax=Clathrus columnatus TaxID=1419009 RepID=A0AAV4ZZI6_9AGAM|nr:hypothetical protein Clacol_001974 [Clathrus columnatus]
MSSSNGSSQKKSTNSDLPSQFKFIEDTLKNTPSTDNDGAADNLAEILKQLDDAGDIAQGVEDKLDKLLGDLEEMIVKLEENKDQKPK